MVPIAITSASLPAKRRILTVCVKLFLEKGYKRTTVAEIVQKADVSNSTFQNIFRAKDGVLTELVEFMFDNQFGMARRITDADLPPVFVYAVETAIQLTLTELNENLREIYIEAYTQNEASEYIFRQSLGGYGVPAEEIERVVQKIRSLDIRAIAQGVMQQLFHALEMRYAFTLGTPETGN